jgi:hypothetical protein
MLTGPRRFNRRVQRQQIGLAGDGLNHQRHPLNVIAAQAQGLDQLTAGVGALTELMHARNRLAQQFAPRATAVMRFAGGASASRLSCEVACSVAIITSALLTICAAAPSCDSSLLASCLTEKATPAADSAL